MLTDIYYQSTIRDRFVLIYIAVIIRYEYHFIMPSVNTQMPYIVYLSLLQFTLKFLTPTLAVFLHFLNYCSGLPH
jgi:hypothetical protein